MNEYDIIQHEEKEEGGSGGRVVSGGISTRQGHDVFMLCMRIPSLGKVSNTVLLVLTATMLTQAPFTNVRLSHTSKGLYHNIPGIRHCHGSTCSKHLPVVWHPRLLFTLPL